MAMILDAFVSQLSEILVNLVKEEVGMLCSVKDEVETLHRKLQLIGSVLDDAERRIEDEKIDSWLKDLRDIMYDADDVIEEYLFKLHLQQLHSTLANSVCCYPSLTSYCYNIASRHRIGSRIKTINARLDEILKEKEQFNLKFDNMNGKKFRLVNNGQSPVSQKEFVGSQIEEDSGKIIDLLVQKKEAKGCLTLGIIGMGGIGKTTLAEKIFTDNVTSYNFPIKMWVYVSKNFDELNVLKQIIREAGGSYHPDETKAELCPKLKRVIEGKKVLLVLDDVWDAKVWNALEGPLTSCAVGSRVVVTTRDEGVVRPMGAIHLHNLQRLPTEDGWLVLSRKALPNLVDKTKVESLKEIGTKIVEKCNGHPLAIQAIGGILLSMPDAGEKTTWEEVLEKLGNGNWSLRKLQAEGLVAEDEVMNILYLSYQALPSRLKPCFLHFSLFSGGDEFGKKHICGLWISEGLVRAEEDLSLEEVAEGYYKELIRRNLLQIDPSFYEDYHCRMHDLFHSLARSLVKEESYNGKFQKLGVGPVVSSKSGPRRLSIVDEAASAIPDSIKQYRGLRTLMLLDTPSIRDVPEDLFTKLGFLRVLALSGTNIISLPRSVGNLMHLRHLDISSTRIREIPEVIGSLVNLQFFVLRSCEYLHSLPRCITNLCNLRYLNFDGSPVDHLPEGMGGLQNLRFLLDFVVGSPQEQPRDDRRRRRGGRGRSGYGACNLEELKSLHEITVLSVTKLERASSDAEARGAALWEKQHLTNLTLEWTRSLQRGGENNEEEIKKIEGVIDGLCPPPSLKVLEVERFFGSRPPSWLDNSCGTRLPKLRALILIDCLGLRQLPPLGGLPQLDFLAIVGASAIVTIGPELMSSEEDGVPFPKLRKLIIRDLSHWEEWQGMEDGSFPRLEVLEINTCPKLRSLPDGLVCVKQALIRDCPCLEKLSNLPTMESLKLYIEDTLPEWLQHDPLRAVQKLEIWCSFDLLEKLLPKEMRGGDVDGPEWYKLQNFPHIYVEDRGDGSNYFFSYTKCPLDFNSNVPR